MTGKATQSRKTTGIGQLSLVEHALCPLDARKSLVENLVFDSKYSFTSSSGERSTAMARVFCPLGLSAADELYLWGLLALTLIQPDPPPALYASSISRASVAGGNTGSFKRRSKGCPPSHT